MSGTFTDLLARYGYIFIALFMFIESIGIPIPGESMLITAGAVAGTGALSVYGVFVAAMLGNVLGGIAGYWMGVRGGHAIVARFGRALRINDERMQKAHTFFEKHGAAALVLGRYIAIVRSFLGIFAGVSDMPKRKFFLYNALGGIIWAAIFSAVGFFFGRNLPAFKRELGRVGIILGVVVALVILFVVGWRWVSANGPRIRAAAQERLRAFDSQPWVTRLRVEHPTAWRLFFLKFARGEYLAVHLAIGFVLSVAAMVLFGVITEDVVQGAPLTRVDVALAQSLRDSATPGLLSFFRFIAGVGGPITIAGIAAGLALLLILRRSWLTLGGWIGAYAGGITLDALLRRIVQRGELPFSPDLLDSDLLAALPTGQTVVAFVTFGVIAHMLVRRARGGPLRVAIVAIALALVAAIGLARLFLGLSYLSTESASVAAGVIWLATTISGLELAHLRRVPAETLA